jgi:signal transduction histidine kinase
VEQHPINWPPCNDSQILLFIMVRDLLTQVVRQARPHRLKICLEPEGPNLSLRVEHDGVGAGDPGSAQPDLGLFSIRERLDRIAGTVAVEATPGQGASITLRVPLCQEDGIP